MSQILYYTLVKQDHWSFYIVCTNNALCFVGSSPASLEEMTDWVSFYFKEAELIKDDQVLEPFRKEFISYLNKERQTFTFDTLFLNGTDFQKKVWNSLKTIPYGERTTYGELAVSIGYSDKAARAVGSALSANPLLIVYPCHRVVPKSSASKGFRGGLLMKEHLLALESTDDSLF
ncbi:methylated-DNA--[protein]-cysteine S-methyltransferase [Alkalibacterium kapii]|uniref:methylated-DNA--[protein]-cysteine S-methyltransferase n=1 Tax=Alkalibacterium kapii TaxID=426704 RepID=A0A511AZZ7_9LACT|nr:methylated-DNA--[protein]-cysteine S-methyltransferase [Alkalibacterium kapii]GEK91157.1 methylated-DNA--[protein]-cysteine S-methyltransferase [Alkalibacterium kapii]